MMSEQYGECRALPTINETFPQFSARPPQQQLQQTHQPVPLALARAAAAGIHSNNFKLSPLDLSLRAGVNIVPITPPSTPSPPRKRPRFMSDEHYLWRPHVVERALATEATVTNLRSSTRAAEPHHFVPAMTYTKREELSSAYGLNEEAAYSASAAGAAAASTAAVTQSFINDNNKEITSNFEEITVKQRSVTDLTIAEYPRHQHPHPQKHQPHRDLATIYVDDDTIMLTEDEANEDDEENYGDVNASAEQDEEQNETLLGSQELNEDDETNEPSHKSPQSPQSARNENPFSEVQDNSNAATAEEEEEEEEYVDILGNDDEDDINPLSAHAVTMLRLQSQADLARELEKPGQALTRNKLVYENEELHNRAIDGLAKLFDRDFQRGREGSQDTADKGKTYIDLTNCQTRKDTAAFTSPRTSNSYEKEQQFTISTQPPSTSRPYKTGKAERKRMKLRKNMSFDEETISPVSGTIIRKLRDDEELVVRKGDIDPAFNVVEVTEEAKAILASIDNKIGAYLCQLCRTLYDDAFKLAQHRCPRIVHIEYKCSECEKVFNCPANLASHRRWHKPKSELLTNSQSKKRLHSERNAQLAGNRSEKIVLDDGVDGVFPCSQCGKTFRRHAYLKKHQDSHQMLENLKSLDIFKNSPTAYQPSSPHLSSSSLPAASRTQSSPLYPALQQPRPYPPRFTAAFPFSAPFDPRRFYTLGEFYLSQQLERSSAFQYVHANHLRSLGNVAGNFINRPVVPSPILPLPVK